jgi:hypothetical protein
MWINNRATALCAIVVGTGAFASEAFVPTSFAPPAESTASGRRTATTSSHAQSSFVGTQVPVRSMPLSTSTSLSMVGNGNLFDRFYRVVRSNVNKFVASIENPEKVIVQAVDDMQVSDYYNMILRCQLVPHTHEFHVFSCVFSERRFV